MFLLKQFLLKIVIVNIFLKKIVKKILNNIYWDDKNHTVKSVECSYDNENWINKHVKVAVYLETSEGKKEVYYKCYFKIVGGNIYITKIGIYLDEEGSVTDLD